MNDRSAAADAVPPTGVEGHDLLATSDAGPATIRGGALQLVGFAFNTALAALAAAVLFRHLGASLVSRYVVAQTLVLLLAGVSDLGLTSIGIRELSVRLGDDRRRFAANLLGARLIVNAVGLSAIVAFTAIAGYGSRLVLGVLLAGLGLVLQTLSDTFRAALLSRLRFGWATASELVRQSVNTALIFPLIAAGAGLVSFLAVAIPASLCALMLTAALARRDVPLRPAFELSELRPMMAAVLPFSIAAAAAAVYFRLSVVLVSLVVSSRQAGYFSVSFRVLETLVTVAAMAAGAAFPIFSRAARSDTVRLRYAVERVLQTMLILGAGAAVAVVLGAPFAISVIGGPKFRPAAHILQIQAISLGIAFLSSVWMQTMMSLGLMREILRMSLGLLVIGSAVIVLGVSVDGVEGAAIATASAELVLTLALGTAVLRHDPGIRPPLRQLPPVAVACALGLSPLLVSGLSSAVRMLLGGAVYLVAVIVFRAVPDEVYAEARHLQNVLAGRSR